MKRKPRASQTRRAVRKQRGVARGASRPVTVTLPATLEIASARKLAASLRRQLDSASVSLLIDGSAVTAVDTAGLQLLVAARMHAVARGLDVQWQRTSPALQQTAAILGLGEALGFAPQAAP